MRYLVIMPDYTGSCIRDEFGDEIKLWNLGLPNDVINEICSWNASYAEIIPLSERERGAKRQNKKVR